MHSKIWTDMFVLAIPVAEKILRPGGQLLMEVGIRMDEPVLALFGPKWEKLPTKLDLQGIPRTVIAQRL